MSPRAKRTFIDKETGWAFWCTPRSFLDRLDKVGPIGVDPFGNEASKVVADLVCLGPGNGAIMMDRGERQRLVNVSFEDGLLCDWGAFAKPGSGRIVFAQPPYGAAIVPCVEKCVAEAGRGVEIVALLPARTDTGWFQDNVWGTADAIRFWRGRIQFENPPPPSCGIKNCEAVLNGLPMNVECHEAAYGHKFKPKADSGSTIANAVAYWGGRVDAFLGAFRGCGRAVKR